jgi:hypothetical protein
MDTRTESRILIAAKSAFGLSGAASGVTIVPTLAVLIVGVVRCWPRGWSTRDTPRCAAPIRIRR